MKARAKKATRAAPPASLLVGWARDCMRSFMAAQILLDLAAQENALLLGMAREQFGKKGFRPGATLVGMADVGVKNFTAAGKTLLDLAAGETALVVEGMKEWLRLPTSAGVMADLVQHRVGTLIGLQKQLLEAAAKQTHTAVESFREGEGLQAGARVAVARQGMEDFVGSEKKFLELAAQEVSAATKGNKRRVKAPRERMKVLAELAQQGAEKYMGAQKKLLDLAIEQLKTVGETKAEHHKEGRKEGQPSWADLTEKSAKNLVTAEKSLLDLAMGRRKKAGKQEVRGTRRAAKKGTAGERTAVAA
jgi:hypothetical protein